MNQDSGFSNASIEEGLQQAREAAVTERTRNNLKLAFSLIDLTSLNTQDTEEKIRMISDKVNSFFEQFPGVPNVAAVCVYPSLIPVLNDFLKAPGVGVASVAGGFPSSQTYLEIKLREAKMAVDSGASEIDIVIPMRHYLENRMQALQDEIRQIKDQIGSVKLKVILETGLLPGPADIYAVSRASLEAGADFIKTSTGKVQPAASPEAVYVMCHAIRDHYNTTGKQAGIKPAGGIGTAEQALRYAGIVELLLGDDWLDPEFFRIGASRLANQILTEINHLDTGSSDELKYF